MENLARKDLTDYEVARAIKYLMDTYPNTYPTQASIADVFGKTQQWVSQHLAMLQLEKDEIITRVIKPEKLSEGQAREILAAPPEKRVEVAEKIAEAGRIPSMREIRKIVKPEKTEFEEQAPIIREEEPRHAAFEIECPECHRKIAIEHVVHPNGKVTHELFREG
jgi:ParB-like chromosome segregation protein Spo0J